MLAALISYSSQLLDGLAITLVVAVASFIASFAAAIILAPIAAYGSPVQQRSIAIYVGLMRGLPELVVILLIFYGGTVLLSGAFGEYVEVDALTAGIVALSVVATAYLVETLRGALLSVPLGQWEGALSLGIRKRRVFLSVILPQMMIRALPGLGNQWLITLKDSALVSIVGLEELMRKSGIAAGATHQPLAFYLAAAGLYISATAFSTLIGKAFDSRLSVHQTER